MNSSDKARDRRYRERQRERGLAQVLLWVPVDQVEAVKTYASTLRKLAAQSGNADK